MMNGISLKIPISLPMILFAVSASAAPRTVLIRGPKGRAIVGAKVAVQYPSSLRSLQLVTDDLGQVTFDRDKFTYLGVSWAFGLGTVTIGIDAKHVVWPLVITSPAEVNTIGSTGPLKFIGATGRELKPNAIEFRDAKGDLIVQRVLREDESIDIRDAPANCASVGIDVEKVRLRVRLPRRAFENGGTWSIAVSDE